MGGYRSPVTPKKRGQKKTNEEEKHDTTDDWILRRSGGGGDRKRGMLDRSYLFENFEILFGEIKNKKIKQKTTFLTTEKVWFPTIRTFSKNRS